MATRLKAVIESRNGEKFSPITIAKNVLTDDGQNLHDILSDRKEDMMTPTIENSSSMFKVGQGDNVDYSGNVVNGAYESMVLKGKTMVNCIQEPSSKDVVLPYAFADGQCVTINDTKESGALGVELKGQTLVNIHKLITPSLAAAEQGWYENLTIASGEISFDVLNTPAGWRYINAGKLNYQMLKPNTKYLVVFESSQNISSIHFMRGDGLHGLAPSSVRVQNNKAIITTNSQIVANEQILYVNFYAEPNTKVSFKNPMILEYIEGMENWDIPYSTGMTSCKMPTLKSVNQMFDYSLATKPSGSGTISFTNNGRSLKANFDVTRDCVNVTNITLPAGTYEMSYEIRGAVTLPDGGSLSSSRAGLSMFKSSQEWYNAESLHVNFSSIKPTKYTKAKKTFTFNESVTIAVVYHGWSNNPVGWCEIKDIRIVPQGKSSILSLPEEVVLRSLPNGVCDIFNTRTGVYTQRIYETTLVGTEEWVLYDASNTNRQNTIAFSANLGLGDVFDNDHTYSRLGGLICDKLTHISSVWGNGGDVVGISADQRNVIIQIEKTRLASENVTGFKAWLTSNNLKVGIQLKTPIVTKINLSSSLKSWNTATHIYSEIPENTLYPILSHSNPSYPVILKPSTKYSIVANSYSNSHTNSTINFNLGGATASATVGNRVTTITTPSTLSNELLTMSGRGNKLNNVMVIEGDVVGDEPYFEGICDCKSPILSNVGKNLFNINGAWEKCSYSMGIPCITYANPKIDIVSQKEFTITTDASGYNNGFGQYIDISTLDEITVEATASFSDAKTSFECKILLLQEGEGLPSSVKTGEDKNFTLRTVSASTSGQRISTNIDTSKFTKMFIMFSGGWKSTMNGSFIFTMKDVYVGDTNQTYEPYKSNTTTFEQKDDKTIVLRSLPNGVCDTLNVETGEYVQNVADIVLDGTEKWILNNWGTNDNYCSFEISSLDNPKIQNVYKQNSYINFYCDTFKVLTNCNWNYMDEKHIRQWSDGNRTTISVIIPKSELKTYNVTGFIEYLTKNNIRINIRANNPIVSTVDIQGFPYAYTNGYVQLSSGSIEQSLTPKVEYSVVTNRNGQIRSNQKMIERHQKQLDRLQAMILTNLVNTQYEQALTNLKYDLKNVREEVK